jgi:autotransporter-associated beta strand protein
LTFNGVTTLVGSTTLTTLSALTLGGVVSGNFDLTKAGAATLTLGGANTFNGVTTIALGSLFASAGALAATSAINVNGGLFNAVDYNSSAPLNVGVGGSTDFRERGWDWAPLATPISSTSVPVPAPSPWGLCLERVSLPLEAMPPWPVPSPPAA